MSGQLVVVGVDGSPASYTALRWALAHAGSTGARVRAAVTAEPMPPIAEQKARAQRVRHAKCPVLVIPPAMATRRSLTTATAGVPA